MKNEAEVRDYLKTLPDRLIQSEHNRRLGVARSEPVVCPICKKRQSSRLALRRHFHKCKAAHPGTAETLTGVIGEEKLNDRWEIVRCFDGSDAAGRSWVADNPHMMRTRRFRRVQRGSKLWMRAVQVEKELNKGLQEKVKKVMKDVEIDVFA